MADINRTVFVLENNLLFKVVQISGKKIACCHQKLQNFMSHFLKQRNPVSFNLKYFLSEAVEGLSASSHREISILYRW